MSPSGARRRRADAQYDCAAPALPRCSVVHAQHKAIFGQSKEAVATASSSPSKPTPNLGRIASGMSLNNARRPDSGLYNLMEKLEAAGMTSIVRGAAAMVLFEQDGHVGKTLNMLKSGGSEAAKKALAAA